MPEKKINIYILSGFLGAGKTTFLKYLLEESFLADSRTALIINEFGKVGVDGKLVDSSRNQTFEINKGSIFCSCTHKDFIDILQQISVDQSVDKVVIEATGITQICDLEKLIQLSNTSNTFEIKGNVCLVDAANFSKVAAYVKSASNQVVWADAIIVNKTDLVHDVQLAKLENLLAGMNPSAEIISTKYGRVSDVFLHGIKHVKRDGAVIQNPPENIYAIGINNDRIFDRSRFMNTVKDLNENVLRIKGNVRFKDGTSFVELAGNQLIFGKACERLGPSQFTVITYGLEKKLVEDVFEICQVN